jgi:adenylyl cyclase-associated protein
VEKQFNDLRIVLLTSAHCKKPDEKAFDELTSAIKTYPEAINKIKEAHWKDREWENHLNVLAGGSPAPLWPLSVRILSLQSSDVLMKVLQPTPAPHVAEIKESVDYYGNKIIKDLKDK